MRVGFIFRYTFKEKKSTFQQKLVVRKKKWNDEKCYVKKSDKEHSDKNLESRLAK